MVGQYVPVARPFGQLGVSASSPTAVVVVVRRCKFDARVAVPSCEEVEKRLEA